MAQKDLAEKVLADYNDVFADIVNGLLFDGEQIVKESELTDTQAISQYKANDNTLHEQERDVAKIWNKCDIQIAFIGMENQTQVDRLMPLRVIGYDGASYRAQLLKEESPHPVITLVLYFGEERWNGRRSLMECLTVPERLEPFVSDYKINVFEIAYLEDRQLEKFKSDFKIVADFFIQQRITRDYKPSKEKMRHVDEILKLLEVLSNDKRFSKIDIKELKEQKYEGGVNMCVALDKIENRGFERGIEQGIERGIETTKYETAINLLQMGLSLEQVAQGTNLPLERIKQIQLECASN